MAPQAVLFALRSHVRFGSLTDKPSGAKIHRCPRLLQDLFGRNELLLVSQGQSMADAIRQICVSEAACSTICSMAKSSILYAKPRLSSRAGAVTTMPSGATLFSATESPAPEVFVSAFSAWPATLHRPAPPATLAQQYLAPPLRWGFFVKKAAPAKARVVQLK
jgi:hypothetical protein